MRSIITFPSPFSSGIGDDDGTHNVEPVDLQAGAHLLTHFQVFYRFKSKVDI